jgi:hypothetical protein
MLSRSTQHKLALVFGSMILLHALIFWQEWPSVPLGFPDFSIFYTAGKILRQGQRTQLYNDALQEGVQKSFSPVAVARRGSILPFNHPPFEAVLFVPLSRVSFLAAYLIFFVINSAILAAALLLLRRNLPALAVMPSWLWLVIGFAFFPAYVALVQGQDSIWVLFCYVMAFRGLRRNADFAAGSWLGLGLCKFHLLLPFVAVMLVRKRFRAMAGFLVVAGGLGLASTAAVGWQAILHYPGYVLWTERVAKFRWNFAHENNPNLRALILSLSPAGESHLPQLVVIAASVALLGIAAWEWKCAAGRDSRGAATSGESPARQFQEDTTDQNEPRQGWHSTDSLQLGMALTMTATLLVSYHTWVQDMALILLPLFLVLDVLLRRGTPTGWSGRILWCSIAVLLCSPLYAVLLLRFSQFRWMAVVLLAFFAATAAASHHLLATTPPAASANRGTPPPTAQLA